MTREHKIRDFLAQNNLGASEVKQIAGDASFRKYFRVFKPDGSTLIVMDAPPEHEKLEPFIKIDHILIENKFLAPEILAIDLDNGFLLLEDFGDVSFNQALKNLSGTKLIERELELYQGAVDVLVDLHQIQNLPKDIVPYDETLLLREVMLFIDWYLPYIVQRPATNAEAQKFRNLWCDLFKKLSNDKKLVLRDYHADNLFVVGNKVGLLDFQDAVLGSRAYDLVSLLEDARRDVSPEVVAKMIKDYLQKSNYNKEQFLTDYQILSLQRNIKIIGIFARLAIRDHKKNYLNFLPRMFEYVILRLRDDLFKDLKILFESFGLK